jgi:hypothetical protein
VAVAGDRPILKTFVSRGFNVVSIVCGTRACCINFNEERRGSISTLTHFSGY